jgi:hypothetical protein
MPIREQPKSLVEALSLVKANKWASVDDMAEWAGVDPATVYSWLAPGGPEPRYNSIRLILLHARSSPQCKAIRNAIAGAFLCGTGLSVAECDGDDCDGSPDTIKSQLLKVHQDAAELSKEVIAALPDGIDHAEIARIRHRAADTKGRVDTVVQSAEKSLEQISKRKLPRLVTEG